MNLKSKRTVYTLSVLLMVLCAACFSTQKETKHILLPSPGQADRDAARRMRAAILAIPNDLFDSASYAGPYHSPLHYRLLRPEQPAKGKKYPLVLVLHGSGAIGTDNAGQLGVLAKLWAKPGICKKYPAYILAPQFPQRSSNYQTDAARHTLGSMPDSCLLTALALVDSLRKALPVNEKKIYVTGFSMGASSTVSAAGLRPDLFAAAIAIAGIPDFSRLDALSAVPLWIIHGNADTENPMAGDTVLFKELQTRHRGSVTFWEVAGWEHDIYPDLYTTEAIPGWLFRH